MPIAFFDLNIIMAGGFLQIGKRQIPIGIRDATDLIKTRHRITNVGGIRHGLFPGAGKGKCRGRQRSLLRRGKAALC